MPPFNRQYAYGKMLTTTVMLLRDGSSVNKDIEEHIMS